MQLISILQRGRKSYCLLLWFFLYRIKKKLFETSYTCPNISWCVRLCTITIPQNTFFFLFCKWSFEFTKVSTSVCMSLISPISCLSVPIRSVARSDLAAKSLSTQEAYYVWQSFWSFHHLQRVVKKKGVCAYTWYCFPNSIWSVWMGRVNVCRICVTAVKPGWIQTAKSTLHSF